MTISCTSTAGGAPAKGNPDRFTGIKALMTTGCFEEATAALEEMAAQAADPIVATLLGQLYHESGEMEKALSHYQQAAELRPDNPGFLKNLGDYYYVAMGDRQEASRVYARILTIAPHYGETLLMMANIAAADQRFEEAEAFFSKVLELDPNHAEAQGNLQVLRRRNDSGSVVALPSRMYADAGMLVKAGRSTEAIALLEKLLELDPNFAPAHNDIGVLRYQAGEHERALVHYEQAAQLDPANDLFIKNLADFYFVKEGRVGEAIQLYLTLFRKNPNDIDVLLSLGHITCAVEHPEEAQLFFQKALEIDPLNGQAREALASLQNNNGNLASSLARLN